ncbi:LysE family transporter [Couchioplanes caeruleus]|uniref:Lysine transporter LysE n=2 Tax=Couchioplanes caeruleus TaxID=56438 RepID=A0A1K0FRD7_9ACTN|nr:LysE family transporter [Couchioplanes caeruleus]OJF15353.1 lysine transporter LysE [Couchioplanes caeruleus subsp. caeruleus]ROP29081.1 arginine exporter protein ArgO [Couchioplanes caeruleus]
MTGAFLAGVIAGYGVAVPVGAIAVLIAGLTARTSLRVGAAAGLGAATADGVYALLAVLGGAALAGLIAPIAAPLRWAAAAVLLLLAAHTAWSALTKPATTRETDRTTPMAAYAGILGLTLLNPATVVYFAALVLGRGGEGGGAWFVLGAFLASASWQLLIAASGALAGRFLTGGRARLITALASSAVIAVLAVALVV